MSYNQVNFNPGVNPYTQRGLEQMLDKLGVDDKLDITLEKAGPDEQAKLVNTLDKSGFECRPQSAADKNKRLVAWRKPH